MNTSQIHHCLTGADLVFKVFAQAPIASQPSECPFYHPPAPNHDKTPGGRRPTGKLQTPPAGLLDPGHDGFITPISPNELQAAPAVVDIALNARKEFLQEEFAARAIGDTGTVHHRQQQQPQDIHHDVAFTPIDLFMDIRSSLFSTFRCLNALAINNRRTGLGLPPFLLADGFDQCRVERVPQPTFAPAPVVPIDRWPRGKVMGQQPPSLPTPHDIENGIENLTVRPGARAAPSTHGQCEQGGQAAPLFIVHIRWVRTPGSYFHPPRLSALFTKRSLTASPY